MKAEIISIGDELLIGQVINTNAVFIAKQLTAVGFQVGKIVTVEDKGESIKEAMGSVGEETKLVVLTGGLGPTKDDLTKQALLEFFKDEWTENNEALENVKRIFKDNQHALIEENFLQAKVPSRAKVLQNERGTAPGLWFENENCIYIALPGVPFEMKGLLIKKVLPELVQRFSLPSIVQKTIITSGLGESLLFERLKDLEGQLPSHIKLAYLPGPGRVRLRLMAVGEDKDELQVELNSWIAKIIERLENHYAGVEGEDSLVAVIATRLTSAKKTLAVSESFTGGKLAGLFTTIPGAATYFKGGVVPYYTEMKTEILGVSPETIQKYSVVSAEVAKEMALKTKEKFGSDYAISTTGNAGPTKGDSDAEIGTAYIGLATPEETKTYEFFLGEEREEIVERAIFKVLEILYKEIYELN